MASIYEKEPIFYLERTWNDKTKLPEKQKFSGEAGKKAEVHSNSGSLGMEFFYEKTLPNFCQAGDEQLTPGKKQPPSEKLALQ
jgi:hypothetical protein